MEWCVLCFQVPLILAVLQLLTVLLDFSSSETKFLLIFITIFTHLLNVIRWTELLDNLFSNRSCEATEALNNVEHWPSPRGSSAASPGVVQSAWAACSHQRAIVRSRLGKSPVATLGLPSLCACACNYQRFTALCSACATLMLCLRKFKLRSSLPAAAVIGFFSNVRSMKLCLFSFCY